ncbi:MAG TPA: DNA internalization-related competence protein ComEC/Rec2 [Steroidobacteraceae bacterium]|nr:DNA internalization-related competence protein ComEC/Rec2 [Steroidobacteraceae bacterium]HNS27533.1 DNA internalization-related competence protein ComEC/Rec2 [Steroidobacteraceae bacterium]
MTLAAAGAFLAGALLALAVPTPYPPHAALAVLLAALGAALAWRAGWPLATVLAAWLLAGLVCAAVTTSLRLAERWPQSRSGERVLVTARVASIPVDEEYGTAFDALLTLDPRAGGQRLRARIVWVHPQPRPQVGERWQLAVRLRAPRAALNPNGPDMERVWFRDRVGALGTVLPRSPLNIRLDPGHAPLDRLRARIMRRIAATVVDRDAAALLGALAVGVTGDMSREQWRVFNATGTTHLVAISGMHVTLFAVIAMAGARRVWRVAGRWCTRLRRESFAAALGIVTAAGYSLLAGFSVPTQRTLLMLSAWLIARHLARAHGALHAFAVALVAVLLLDPLAPLASGFWLSFGAVAAILLATGARLGRAHWLHEAVRVQCAVTIALVPVTLAAFGSVSLASLVVNAAAIPLFTLLLVPLVLAATAAMALWPALATLLLQLAAWLHAQLWPWLEAAADWPHALVQLAPPAWAYLLVVPAAGMAVLPWPRGLRATAAAAILPLGFARALVPAADEITVAVFDVGRGQAVAIRTADGVLVHGTGDSFGTEGRRMARVVVPWLRTQRVARVDDLVLPHLYRDYAVGAAELDITLGIDRILVARPWPGGPQRAVTCDAHAGWTRAAAHFALTATCDMTVTVGANRLEVTGKEVFLDTGAGRQHLDSEVRGAIILTLGKAAGAVRRRDARDGYPWPWRAPV